MKLSRTAEIDYEDFSKLPRRMQMFVIDDLVRSGTNDNNDLWKYGVVGFNTDGCKSPIEQMMCFALNMQAIFEEYCFETQKEIVVDGKKYIADFSIFRYVDDEEEQLNVLVECDGHEYHQKTKAQVRRNNERDFALKMAGYDVLHFSGSQIYEDPFKCAQDVYEFCNMKVGKTHE